MIAGSRVKTVHSRQVLALWLITFIGVLLQLGLCSPDLPAEVVISALPAPVPVGAGSIADGDGATGRPGPDQCHLLRACVSARSASARRRADGLASVGVLTGWLLLAGWTGTGDGGLLRVRHRSRSRDMSARRARGRLLIRLCVSRT